MSIGWRVRKLASRHRDVQIGEATQELFLRKRPSSMLRGLRRIPLRARENPFIHAESALRRRRHEGEKNGEGRREGLTMKRTTVAGKEGKPAASRRLERFIGVRVAGVLEAGHMWSGRRGNLSRTHTRRSTRC